LPRPTCIYIEGTFQDAPIITAGTYDLENVQLCETHRSDNRGSFPNKSVVRVTAGVTLENASFFKDVAVVFQSDSPAIILPYKDVSLGTTIVARNSAFSSDSGLFGPVPTLFPIQVDASTAITLLDSDLTNFVVGVSDLISVDLGASLLIDARGFCIFQGISGVFGRLGTVNISSGPDISTGLPQPVSTLSFFQRDCMPVSTPCELGGSAYHITYCRRGKSLSGLCCWNSWSYSVILKIKKTFLEYNG